jgi:hypothetical protein
MATISDFKNNFRGGVRPNLFQCSITAPVFGQMNLQFLGKATHIPASSIAKLEIPFRGRNLAIPGDRTFNDWTVTILNDPDWQNRTAMEEWMNQISNHSQNTSSLPAANVYGQATVQQLGRSGNTIRTYRLQDILPTEVAQIDLTMDSGGTPEEYAVTFAVNNWVVDGAGMDGSSTGGVDVSISGSINLGGVTIGGSANF